MEFECCSCPNRSRWTCSVVYLVFEVCPSGVYVILIDNVHNLVRTSSVLCVLANGDGKWMFPLMVES